jgi:hypothetical protein
MAALTIAPGATLPPGTYRLGAERHAKLVAALGSAAPSDGSAHPLATWLIAMGGIGVSIAELFDAAGVPLEDGPMLGSAELEQERPLDVDATYTVSGEVTELLEKTGRKLGRFDVLTIRLHVAGEDGEPAARLTCSMILPRP